MKYYYKKYEKKYLKDCAQMVRDTWEFEKTLVNPRKPEILYEYYIRDCENYSEHLEILADENDHAKGILFGSIEKATIFLKIKYSFKNIRNYAGMLYHILNGDLGKRKAAWKTFQVQCEYNLMGESDNKKFDSEVNLFIMSPDLRGKGYGKKMMDRYVKFCRKNNLSNAFLWTTPECTYTFYEKYGFKLFRKFEVKAPALKDTGGMVYYLQID